MPLKTYFENLSNHIWTRLSEDADENWSNGEVVGSIKVENPAEFFAVISPNEPNRGGDIEIWVLDQDMVKMICLVAQGKRLYRHPNVGDAYDELNYTQLDKLLKTGDSEKSIPLYFLYNGLYDKGFFETSSLGKDNGFRYAHAHEILNKYVDSNGVDSEGISKSDLNSDYKKCRIIHPITKAIHQLIPNMIKDPRSILVEYDRIRSSSLYDKSFVINVKDFIKLVPKEIQEKMTNKQIVMHETRLAYIPLGSLSMEQKRPLIIVHSYEYFL